MKSRSVIPNRRNVILFNVLVIFPVKHRRPSAKLFPHAFPSGEGNGGRRRQSQAQLGKWTAEASGSRVVIWQNVGAPAWF